MSILSKKGTLPMLSPLFYTNKTYMLLGLVFILLFQTDTFVLPADIFLYLLHS